MSPPSAGPRSKRNWVVTDQMQGHHGWIIGRWGRLQGGPLPPCQYPSSAPPPPPPPPPPPCLPRRPHISFPVMRTGEPGAFLGVPMRHGRGGRHARHTLSNFFLLGWVVGRCPLINAAPAPSPPTPCQFSGDAHGETRYLSGRADAARAGGQTHPAHII